MTEPRQDEQRCNRREQRPVVWGLIDVCIAKQRRQKRFDQVLQANAVRQGRCEEHTLQSHLPKCLRHGVIDALNLQVKHVVTVAEKVACAFEHQHSPQGAARRQGRTELRNSGCHSSPAGRHGGEQRRKHVGLL